MRIARARDASKLMLTRYPRVYDAARRPYSAGRFWLRRPHDAEYGVFALFTGREGVFLDVGANAGMSALTFRIYNRRSPIVSIEANPFHEPDLRFVSRLAQPFTYHIVGADSEPRTTSLYVPHYGACR